MCFCNNYCIINHILTNWISFFIFFFPFIFSIFSPFSFYAVSVVVVVVVPFSLDMLYRLLSVCRVKIFIDCYSISSFGNIFILPFLFLFRLFYTFFIYPPTFLSVPLVMCFFPAVPKENMRKKNYKTTQKTNPLRESMAINVMPGKRSAHIKGNEDIGNYHNNNNNNN